MRRSPSRPQSAASKSHRSTPDRSPAGSRRAAASAPPSTTPSVSDLLWHSTDVFDERHRKSASALIAVARVLERQRPLDGAEDEFLAAYAGAREAKPSLFTRVWTDPIAYFWVRMAYQLLAACVRNAPLSSFATSYCAAIGATDPRAALAAHLDDFKRFTLALAVLGRSTCTFTSPLRVRLPFAIPGTRLTLDGDGSVAILGFGRRRLTIAAIDERGELGATITVPLAPGAAPPEGAMAIREEHEAGHAGAHVVLQPAAFNIPGFGYAEPALAAGREYQRRHRGLVARTLAMVHAHHRETFRQFASVMRTIALKPYRSGVYTNISHSDLPGAFIASVIADPYELADTFIHEFHHNRFFFIEERGPFFAGDVDNAVADGAYYSPWRDDARPLHGLLHAVYVTIPVAQFWLNVFGSTSLDKQHRAYTIDRIIRTIGQLDLGVAELERHARLSDFGRSLFEQMKTDVAALHEAAHFGCRVPSDAPAFVCRDDGTFEPEISKLHGRALTVREAVEEHAARFGGAGLVPDTSAG